MKILLLTHWFFEYTIELANALSKYHTVSLYLCIGKKNKKNVQGLIPFVSKNVNLNIIDYPRFRNARVIFTNISILKKIYSEKADIIHFQGAMFRKLKFIYPFLRNYKKVITLHDPKNHLGEESPSNERRKKWLVERSDAIIIHGKKIMEETMETFDVERDMIAVIPHGEFSIYGQYEDDDKIREEQNTILFFGRIHEYKGLEYLIKAEPLISEDIPNLKIIIAGSGEKFQVYKNKIVNIDRYEIHNRYIANEEIPQFFGRAAIVVLPYIDASQSGVVPLAYAFGKPVVVTDVGSIPEVVDDGITGFIVPPRDFKAIAEAIIKLLKDDELRKRMGDTAYQKTQSELSWDTIAHSTIKVYEKVLKS